MLQVKEPLDVFMSHDWPRGIEQYGNTRMLLRFKKHFIQEVSKPGGERKPQRLGQ
jgi:lariat debranching enzyme